MPKLYAFLSTFKERINQFYLLASIPLILFIYYHVQWPFSVIIPIYGLLLLIIKRQKFLLYRQAGGIPQALGLLMVLASFFVYYVLVLFLPSANFYTEANYTIFLLGLCLTFFESSALKDIVSPVFLIVAATSSSFVSEWLEPYLSPYVTAQFAYLIEGILNTLGITAIVYFHGNSPTISFPTMQGGQIMALFNWYCVGVSSLLIFSIILVILIIEEPCNLKSRMIWSTIGISGILILNVLRVAVILLADYFYGAEVGGTIHYGIGYTMFITWLTIFLYLFSKKTV